MKKTIIIIYPNSFPISSSGTNRIISIGRGLIEQGNLLKIIINRPTEKKDSQINFQQNGIFKGISFEYATKSLIWPDNKILKFIYLQLGMLFTCYKILKEDKKTKVDVLISAATYGYLENLIYSFISKCIKVKIIHTIDEYPWVLINYDQYSDLYRKFYLKYYYRLFDGFIVMTKTLLSYYKSLSAKRAKFIHIPMSVEFDRFNIKVPKLEEEYIAYCGGDKTGTKDGVDILINSFNLIKDNFPNIKLYIIGNVNQSVHRLVETLNLSCHVKFLGFIERDKIPEYLINAKILCLARPNNLQAEGGFPTKLGEYLATGNPVVVTNVGEIPNYLNDNESAFIAEANSVESFAKKLSYVLEHPFEAKVVGEKGRKVAELFFNYRNSSADLSKFLETI